MKKLVLHLRSKPEHVRIQILYVSILVLTVVMIGFWIYIVGNTNTPTNLKQDLEPFTMLKDSIIDSTKDISWPIKNQ